MLLYILEVAIRANEVKSLCQSVDLGSSMMRMQVAFRALVDAIVVIIRTCKVGVPVSQLIDAGDVSSLASLQLLFPKPWAAAKSALFSTKEAEEEFTCTGVLHGARRIASLIPFTPFAISCNHDAGKRFLLEYTGKAMLDKWGSSCLSTPSPSHAIL